MAYSKDFRERVIAYMDKGYSFAELKEIFNIYPARYYAWLRLLSETGGLEPRPITGRPPSIDIALLKDAVAEKPDAYLRELAEPFGCSAVAVHYALKKIGITYKKNTKLPRTDGSGAGSVSSPAQADSPPEPCVR
jgi:transposase